MSLIYDKNNIRAIIGLGNPGEKYYKTRHNIGFRVLDELATKYGSTWNENTNMAYANITGTSAHSIYLLKPLTFMNNSGNVLPWLTKKGIKSDQIIVVHDELEKSFASLAIRLGGSARGHNGLRSIISTIGQDFWRLRIGIGRPSDATLVGDFVLQPFNLKEEAVLAELISKACTLLEQDYKK